MSNGYYSAVRHLLKRRAVFFLSRFPLVYRAILWASFSRNDTKKAFLTHIKNGDTVLDIGANFGDFTILFSDIVGPAGKVFAFEPVPPTGQALAKRVKSECRFPNVFLNNFALGSKAGSAEIYVPSGDFGQASLRMHTIGSWARDGRQIFDCEIQTLDQFVAKAAINELNFIKIDAEGAELPILIGGKTTLVRYRPLLHLEFFSTWTHAFQYSATDLIAFLRSAGYEHFFRDDMTPLKNPVQELSSNTDSQNIICSVTPRARR